MSITYKYLKFKLDTNLFSFTTEHQYEKFIDMKTFEDYDHSFFGYSTEEFLALFSDYGKLQNLKNDNYLGTQEKK